MKKEQMLLMLLPLHVVRESHCQEERETDVKTKYELKHM